MLVYLWDGATTNQTHYSACQQPVSEVNCQSPHNPVQQSKGAALCWCSFMPFIEGLWYTLGVCFLWKGYLRVLAINGRAAVLVRCWPSNSMQGLFEGPCR